MKAMIPTAATALLLLTACGETEEQAEVPVEEIAERAEALRLAPGQWETTVEILDVEMEGMPEGMPNGMMKNMVGTTTTMKSCITPEQAAMPSADFLAAQKEANCSYSSFDMSGGLLRAAMTCAGTDRPGELKLNMTGKYSAKSYEMNQEMRMADFQPGMTMAMKSKVTARHVGDCPAG